MENYKNTSQKTNCLAKLHRYCKYSLTKKSTAQKLLKLKKLNLLHECKEDAQLLKKKCFTAEEETTNHKSILRKLLSSKLQFVKEEQPQSSNYEAFEEFQAAIFKFANKYCQVCHKLLYEHQLFKFFLINGRIPQYLPKELTKLPFLRVCKACNAHLSGNKGHQPAVAYWNNLLPGEIPQEISIASQMELRLIARTLPFFKIVKFNGVFGQAECEGQAILFAQNVMEMNDEIRNTLPRSTVSADIAIASSHFGNVQTVLELMTSKERINNALNWLIANNPLYKDVTNVTESLFFVIKDLFCHQPLQINRHTQHKNPDFMGISHFSRFVQASFNQSNKIMFQTNSAGAQCCTNALSAIVLAHIKAPSQWNQIICDEWLIMGNKLYEIVRVWCVTTGNTLPTSGFLFVRNFNVIKHYLVAFNKAFSINFDDDPAIFGSLSDCENRVGVTLMRGLQRLFQHHSCGILIASAKCYAVMKFEDKYYFADPHSCDDSGAPAADETGRACVIECDTLIEFYRIVRRATKSNNEIYTLDYIKVNYIVENKRVEPIKDFPQQSFAITPYSTCLMNSVNSFEIRRKALLDSFPNLRATDCSVANFLHAFKAEELAFFFLFPYGKNGFYQDRPVRITPLEYFQTRILGADLRFQRNDYLFYAYLMLEYHQFRSIISSLCGQKVERENVEFDDINIYVKNLHGSSNFWKTALNDLIAQVRCIGPPHYFITFSCNDLSWLDMRKALLVADNDAERDPTSLTTYDTQILVEKYPTVVCRHLTTRIKALLKFMKTDREAFGGPIVDHWWRIEFPSQGSPLLHVLVWVEKCVDFDSNDGVRRVNDVVTCALPNDPKLKLLVENLQIHKHDQICTTNSASFCRLNFPRPVCQNTTVLFNTPDELADNSGNFCVLKRKNSERYISNYNVTLLKLWKASMDIQPCGSIDAFAYFIAKFIFKSVPSGLDQALTDAIKNVAQMHTVNSQKLFTELKKIDEKRQVSVNECVFRLCQFRLYGSSRKCIFFNKQKPNEEYQILKFGNVDAREGFYSNSIETYVKRPHRHSRYNFNDMCLIDFVTLFELTSDRKRHQDGESGFDERFPRATAAFLTLLDGSKVRIRHVLAVVRVPYVEAAVDSENYYYSLLVQYYPFRAEEELLDGFSSAKESFLAKEETILRKSTFLEHLKREQQLRAAFGQALISINFAKL